MSETKQSRRTVTTVLVLPAAASKSRELRQYVTDSHLHSGGASGQEAGDEDHQPDGGHAGPEDHEGQLCRLDPDHNIEL